MRAAAIEAGIIKPVPTVRITGDIPVIAARLCQHLTREQISSTRPGGASHLAQLGLKIKTL